MEFRQTSEIVYREDLYPRVKASPEKVQEYAENIEVLPPIEVNQNNELIDGFHRWTAHRKVERAQIPVIVTRTAGDAELLELAIQRNATHGHQLSNSDKREMSRKLYLSDSKKYSKDSLAGLLSVSKRSVDGWLSDIDKAARERRRQIIRDMWLACYTETEIAECLEVDQMTVNREVSNISADLQKSVKVAFFEEGWQTPIYNIWSFAKNTNRVNHFGKSEQTIVDYLLYLYTNPLDIVVDPFGGGGSTIDVCRERMRRYWVSDRKPIVERENEIRKLDIVQELPPLNKRWSDVSLTYLDPPYWKQAEGQYSNDPEDLANMPLTEFTEKLASVVRRISEKQSHGVIAMLIQPTQWKAENKQFTDHVFQIIQAVGNKRLVVENRVSCPYSTEQCTPQMVEYAKDNKKLLVLSRELIIWRIV